LVPAQLEDVLELDELWSFVHCKACWVWVALCRRTRQVVFWFAGDRSADSCRQPWAGIPDAYWAAHTYSDFWQAYQGVFGENHQSVGKETGQTAQNAGTTPCGNVVLVPKLQLGNPIRKALALRD
jgi:IS1 family transposase